MITNSTGTEIDDQSWEELAVVNDTYHIKRMIIADYHSDYIYTIRSDEVIWGCETYKKNVCKIFNKVFFHLGTRHTIIGIDYHDSNEQIYVSSWNGVLWHCTTKACGGSIAHFPKKYITSLSVKFNAIWLGVREKYDGVPPLMKCPIRKEIKNFNQTDCQVFKTKPAVDDDMIHIIEAG